MRNDSPRWLAGPEAPANLIRPEPRNSMAHDVPLREGNPVRADADLGLAEMLFVHQKRGQVPQRRNGNGFFVRILVRQALQIAKTVGRLFQTGLPERCSQLGAGLVSDGRLARHSRFSTEALRG